MVLPVVNSLKPVSPRAIQCAIVSHASGARMSHEKTPVNRSGWAVDGVRDVGVVVSVARRRLNQSGFPDAGPVLLHDQLLNADRALLGPG